MGKEENLMRAVILLSLGGIGVSGYLTANHYRLADATFCSFAPSVSCDIVNRGPYSEIFGIPVALIGSVGFVLIFFLALSYGLFDNRLAAKAPEYVAFVSLVGSVFGSYLTYIELFVINLICILCVGAFSAGLAIFVLSLAWTSHLRRGVSLDLGH